MYCKHWIIPTHMMGVSSLGWGVWCVDIFISSVLSRMLDSPKTSPTPLYTASNALAPRTVRTSSLHPQCCIYPTFRKCQNSSDQERLHSVDIRPSYSYKINNKPKYSNDISNTKSKIAFRNQFYYCQVTIETVYNQNNGIPLD